jgi:hypothetical protein
MINIYHQKLDEMWYAAAVEDDKVLVTNFGSNESKVVKQLLESLPYNVPFQMAEKPIQFSENLLATLNSVFMGKDIRRWGFKGCSPRYPTDGGSPYRRDIGRDLEEPFRDGLDPRGGDRVGG